MRGSQIDWGGFGNKNVASTGGGIRRGVGLSWGRLAMLFGGRRPIMFGGRQPIIWRSVGGRSAVGSAIGRRSVRLSAVSGQPAANHAMMFGGRRPHRRRWIVQSI